MANRPLTAKQSSFVREYLKDFCAGKAAVRAGYAPKSADQQGYQLLQLPSVAEAVKAGQAKAESQAEASAADLRAFWTKVLQDATEEMRNRLKASEYLSKSRGLFVEKREIDVGKTLLDLLTEDAAS